MTICAAHARFVSALAALVVLTCSGGRASDARPYLGSWSNGRGETLVISAKTIRFGEGRALAYKDITRATDGSLFELQVTARGAENAFGGSTLAVECDGDSMKISAYDSHAAYMRGADPQSVVTWFKDDSEEADE